MDPEVLMDYVLPDSVEPAAIPPASSVVMTSDGEMSRLGRYVTADDAFHLYQAQTHRSLRKTAQMLGLPQGTVFAWSSRYGWRQRLLEQDMEVTEGVVQSVAVAVLQSQVSNIQQLVTIRDDEKSSNREKLEAIKQLTAQYERLQDRALVQSLTGGQEDQLEEDKLVELVQTPEGAQVLLQRLRERTGMA